MKFSSQFDFSHNLVLSVFSRSTSRVFGVSTSRVFKVSTSRVSKVSTSRVSEVSSYRTLKVSDYKVCFWMHLTDCIRIYLFRTNLFVNSGN